MSATASTRMENVVFGIKRFLASLWNSTKKFFSVIFHNKKSFAGLIIISVFVFFALFGRLIFPFDPTETSYSDMYLSPSWEHWLGTDNMGRDLFRELVYGTQSVLSIAFLTALFTLLLGTIIGLVSGLFGGTVDKVLSLVTNLFMSIPSFPILMILATIVTINNNLMYAIILSIFSWGGLARAIRSQVMSIKHRDYIEICQVMGLSRAHITFSEIMPNIFSFLAINFIMAMKNAITGSVGLMILGLATFDPTNWGAIIINAKDSGALVIQGAWLVIVAPIVCIILFQLGSLLFANGLDEAMNPRLRKE